MTSDYDTATGELVFETAVSLWRRGQEEHDREDAALQTVTDDEIAEATVTELSEVRYWLDTFDGDRLVVGRVGDTRTVKGLVDPAV